MHEPNEMILSNGLHQRNEMHEQNKEEKRNRNHENDEDDEIIDNEQEMNDQELNKQEDNGQEVDEDKIQDEDDVVMWNDAEDEARNQAGALEDEVFRFTATSDRRIWTDGGTERVWQKKYGA